MLHTLMLVVISICGESKCGAVLRTESTAVMTNEKRQEVILTVLLVIIYHMIQ